MICKLTLVDRHIIVNTAQFEKTIHFQRIDWDEAVRTTVRWGGCNENMQWYKFESCWSIPRMSKSDSACWLRRANVTMLRTELNLWFRSKAHKLKRFCSRGSKVSVSCVVFRVLWFVVAFASVRFCSASEMCLCAELLGCVCPLALRLFCPCA